MRLVSLVCAVLLTVPCVLAEDAPAPAPVAPPAPAPAEHKISAKEVDAKIKAIREEAIKGDADLAKLKAEADDARKHFETAMESKLKDNAEYRDLKRRQDEQRAKKEAEKPKHKEK